MMQTMKVHTQDSTADPIINLQTGFIAYNIEIRFTALGGDLGHYRNDVIYYDVQGVPGTFSIKAYYHPSPVSGGDGANWTCTVEDGGTTLVAKLQSANGFPVDWIVKVFVTPVAGA